MAVGGRGLRTLGLALVSIATWQYCSSSSVCETDALVAFRADVALAGQARTPNLSILRDVD